MVAMLKKQSDGSYLPECGECSWVGVARKDERSAQWQSSWHNYSEHDRRRGFE